MASALNTPVSVLPNASEGGAWGIGVLALYMISNSDLTLEEYLEAKIFNDVELITIDPEVKDVHGFKKFAEKNVLVSCCKFGA